MHKQLFTIISVFFALAILTSLYAQKGTISVTASYGINYFNGDIPGDITGSGGMSAAYQVFDNVSLGYGFNFGTLSGKDAAFVYNNHTGVSFANSFFIHGLSLGYKFSHLIFPTPVSLHIMELHIGSGLINFRDRLETLDGQYLAGYGYHTSDVLKESGTNELYFSGGISYKYRFNKNMLIGVAPSFIWVNTDKLDFVKGNDKKDNYFFFPLTLEYKLFRKTS